MRKASKLSEVAKLAGVSPITASRAIRGVGYVSDTARARIMEAAAQLNYTPDLLARRMRGEKSKLLGVFVNNYGSLVLHELIRTISDEARPRGYDLIVFNAERFDRPGRMETSDMLSKLCDGLLLLLPNTSDHYLDVIQKQKFPCVLVNFDARALDLPVVVAENRLGARTAVEYLLSLGHRRIAFIAGTNATGQSAERQRGYVDALEAAGLAIEPELIGSGAFVQGGGYAAAEQMLSLAHPPTAIFCANDEMAFGAIDAASSKGLRVPDDVSVIGFDDIPTASSVFPKLSTMRQPFNAMAARAVSEVVGIIEGAEIGANRIAFPTELIIRNSTGPVRPPHSS